MSGDFDDYYEATEPGRRERASAWATAIGLQEVDGLKPSKYLIETAKRHIEGKITQVEAWRIVDEYYETKEGHDLPDDGVNDGVRKPLNATEEKAVKAILRNARINAAELAKVLGVKKRQAERVVASLKKKAGLKRRGADKNGEWHLG